MIENVSALVSGVEKLRRVAEYGIVFFPDERKEILAAMSGCWQVDVFELVQENGRMREKLREQAKQIITLRGRAEARENTEAAWLAAKYLRSLGYTEDNINTLFTNKNAEEGLWFVD